MCSSIASKLIVITGGTKGGLGYEAARYLLANTPHRIILTLRDESKANQALSGLEQSSSRSAMQRVSTVLLDLLSSDSVKKAAEEIKMKSNCSIDALVLNAGVVPIGSTSGHDAYRVNHLSQMLLTHLLLPSLTTTAKKHSVGGEGEKEEEKGEEEEAKIVIVSSGLHSSLGTLPPSPSYFSKDRAGDATYPPSASGIHLYGLTKLYNLWFAYKLHRLLQGRQQQGGQMKEGRRGVKVTAFSPGFVPNTNLSANQGFLAQAFMTYIMPLAPFAVRKEDAGKALADLAVSNEVQSGLYYTKGQVKETSPVSRDEAKQDELWSISCQELEISEGEGGFGMSPS